MTQSHVTTSHIHTSQAEEKRTQRRSSWADHRPQWTILLKYFESMNRVARPRTTVQMLTNMTNMILRFTCQRPHNAIITWKREHKEEVLRPRRHTATHIIASHLGNITQSHLTTSHILHISPHHTSHHITHHKPKEENTKNKFLCRVLGPDVEEPNIRHNTSFTSHHIKHPESCTSHHITHRTISHITTRKKFLGRVLGPDVEEPSSWAGCWRTEHQTSHILHISPQQTSFTSHHITHRTTSHSTRRKKRTQRTSSWPEFLGRMEEVLGPSSWAGKVQKSTSFFMKTPFKSIPEDRKVRELPRKMSIEEVEERKKYENYHAKPVWDPFKSIADHRKVRELPGKMNIEEVEEPETT